MSQGSVVQQIWGGGSIFNSNFLHRSFLNLAVKMMKIGPLLPKLSWNRSRLLFWDPGYNRNGTDDASSTPVEPSPWKRRKPILHGGRADQVSRWRTTAEEVASGDGGRMTCDVRRVGAAAVHHRSTSTAKNDCATNRLTSPSSVAHAVPAPPCRRPCFTAGIDTARRRRRRQCKLTRQRAAAYVTRTASGGSRN